MRPPIEEWKSRFAKPLAATVMGGLFEYIDELEKVVAEWAEAFDIAKHPENGDDEWKEALRYEQAIDALKALAKQIPKEQP